MIRRVYREIAPVSGEDRAAILRKTAYSLPDDPSARGMTPDQIRKRFWSAIAGEKQSVLQEIDRVAWETNEALDALWARISGAVGGGSVIVTDDGEGNVFISSSGAASITDDGNGNVVIT